MVKRRSFTPEFKAQMVLEASKEEETTAELASRFAVHPRYKVSPAHLVHVELIRLKQANLSRRFPKHSGYLPRCSRVLDEIGRLTGTFRPDF